MRANIHPNYSEMVATCSCGNVVHTHSTLGRNLNIDICAKCHPFYTGKQRVVDTARRVERFNRKYKRKTAEE